ncbi:MAG TPA: hypothetical protein VFA05_10385 [Gaiellaceae bacterium]|nr:hypothetical protein [Gaiellaceae bacterium]
MSEPVSWLLIEPGWTVESADGAEVGRVEAVTGDSNADIFDGLAIASGMFARPKYVPAERVGEIVEGRVRLTLDRNAVEQLGEYEVPAEAAEVEPEAAPLAERWESRVAPGPQAHRPGLLRRALDWLGLAGRR